MKIDGSLPITANSTTAPQLNTSLHWVRRSQHCHRPQGTEYRASCRRQGRHSHRLPEGQPGGPDPARLPLGEAGSEVSFCTSACLNGHPAANPILAAWDHPSNAYLGFLCHLASESNCAHLCVATFPLEDQHRTEDCFQRKRMWRCRHPARWDHSASTGPPPGRTRAGSCRTTHSHSSPADPGSAAPARTTHHRHPDQHSESGCRIPRSCCSTPRSPHRAPDRSPRAVCPDDLAASRQVPARRYPAHDQRHRIVVQRDGLPLRLADG